MSGRGRLTRILCVNCNICMNRLRRYPALELDTRVITLFSSWIHPRIITEDDYVCEACRDIAMCRVNHALKQEASGSDDQQTRPSHYGHTNVCLLCGLSILRRQSDRILTDNPSVLQQSMINILESRVAPRQVLVSDRVCHPCWLRTKREARRGNIIDDTRSLPSSTNSASQEDDQPSGSNEPKSNPIPQGDVQSIVLPDYRRAANANSHCVYPNCSSNTLHGISDSLRAIVLSNHNYYLPRLARICSEHLMSNSWETLFDSENSIQTFTAQQVSVMASVHWRDIAGATRVALPVTPVCRSLYVRFVTYEQISHGKLLMEQI